MNARSNRPFIFSGVAVVLVAVLGLGIWYQFFRDDAPAPVSLESAVDAASRATATVSATAPTQASTATLATATTGTSASAEQTSTGLSGTWAIQSESESFIGYRIGEELARIGTTEAVGRTSTVDGNAVIDGMTLVSATFTADMTTLKSDESRRDRALSDQSLETRAFPTATFALTTPLTLPDTLLQGEKTSLSVAGDLTLHGVTRAIELPLQAQYTNGTLVIVGSLDVALADYQIEKPRAPSVLSVDDHGTIELQLFLSPGA